MKKLILLIPVIIILAGCDASGGRKIPAPSADILNSGANQNNVDCTKTPWKDSQKYCGYVDFRQK